MKVSVMTPVFNPTDQFLQCLKSVAQQTHRDVEHIIVDDGSANDPQFYIDQLADNSHVRLIRLGKNRGRGAARQKALEESTGEFLTMVDADDWILQKKIELQIDFLKRHPEVDLVSSAMLMQSDEGDAVGVENYGHTGDQVYASLTQPQSLGIPHAPSLIRGEVARLYRYDQDLRSSEDFDFMLQILLRHRHAFLCQPLYVYSFFESKTLGRAKSQLAASRRVFRKYFATHPVPAAKYHMRSFLKQGFYIGLNFLPFAKSWFVGQRYQPVSEELHNQFLVEKSKVL